MRHDEFLKMILGQAGALVLALIILAVTFNYFTGIIAGQELAKAKYEDRYIEMQEKTLTVIAENSQAIRGLSYKLDYCKKD